MGLDEGPIRFSSTGAVDPKGKKPPSLPIGPVGLTLQGLLHLHLIKRAYRPKGNNTLLLFSPGAKVRPALFPTLETLLLHDLFFQYGSEVAETHVGAARTPEVF